MKPSVLKERLKISLSTAGKMRNVMIKGAPGVGKTMLVEQAMKEIGIELMITHPVVADPTDYKGLPIKVVDPETGEEGAKFVPYAQLKYMINATNPLAVFIDDLGQAPRANQCAIMQIIMQREIDGHPISDHVRFVMATNRAGDRAGCDAGIIEPLKSRARIYELDPDLDDWAKWALTDGNIVPDMVAFLRSRPTLLHDFEATKNMVNTPNPRTWNMASESVNDGLDELEDLGACVGEGPASEYIAFRRTFNSMPNPDGLIMKPDTAAVPTKPDVLFAVAGALAYRAKTTNFSSVLTYAARMPKEFETVLVRDAIFRDDSLEKTDAFTKWATDNSEWVL